MEMLTLEDALDILLSKVKKINEVEEVSLWDSVGRIISTNIKAVRNQPPFDRSPLDGYAVRSQDLSGASREHPVILEVLDEVDAGYVTDKKVTEGTAVRIMTGAPIPEGADCIIGQEDTDYGEEKVQIYEEKKAYQNYCFEGEDYKVGTVLLEEGTQIGAIEAGVLASLGLETVQVYRRARVAVLTTGDEIVIPGEALLPGKIYDSNLYALGTRLQSLGVELTYKGRVGDDPKKAAETVKEIAKEADLIITTGGVSVGKKDIMHEVLKLLPATRLFWKLSIKPGMPTLCGEYQEKLLVCLSGNPYGATVNLELLVRPMLAKMTGRKELEIRKVKVVSEGEFFKQSNVRRYLRASYEDGKVFPITGSNASGVLSTMCGCNCLIEIPAGMKELKKGDEVEVVLL